MHVIMKWMVLSEVGATGGGGYSGECLSGGKGGTYALGVR